MAKSNGFAWSVQVEEKYGTRFVRARIVIPQENGDLHNPSNNYPTETGYEFADFRVTAYLGHDSGTFGVTDSNPGEIWGLGHEFAPFTVSRVERAAAMVKVFRTVSRGLTKAESESGYVKDGDFHTYLLRIGAALGIRTYYVRNGLRQRNMTGEIHRKVTPATLQWWIGDVQDTAINRPGELIQR
jgi:hypothetical protein